MRVPIYCNETFEALTIIKLEHWALRMLDQGCVYLRFAPQRSVSYARIDDASIMLDAGIDVCTIRFDRLHLKEMKTWIGVTGDGPTAIALRSVFLPGQQSEVRQAERDAQSRFIEDMMNNLSK